MSESLGLTDYERECTATSPGFDELPPHLQETVLCDTLISGICKAVGDLNAPKPPRHRVVLLFKRWRRRRQLRQNFRTELKRLSRHFGCRVDIIQSRTMGDSSEARDVHPLSFGLQLGGPVAHPGIQGWRRWALWTVYLLVPRSNRQEAWGDLLEDRRDLLSAGNSKWQANVAAIVEIADLLWRRPLLLRFGGLVGTGLVIEVVRRILRG